MGCSTCKTGCGSVDGGCSKQKNAQKQFLGRLLPRLYPESDVPTVRRGDGI